MTKLKIYGPLLSRARRTLWIARELGLDFEQISLDMQALEHKQPWYLNINPVGKVPAIDDNGYILWESFAINLYLAKKYDSPLKPKNLEEEGKILQWTFFAATELDGASVQYALHSMFLEPEKRIPAMAQSSLELFQRFMDVVEAEFAKHPYLLGEEFTLADLNLAGSIGFAYRIGMDLSAWPKTSAWLDRCLSRPAAKDQKD